MMKRTKSAGPAPRFCNGEKSGGAALAGLTGHAAGALQRSLEAPAGQTTPAGRTQAAPKMPLGLYVHIPFCAERCFYCDFLTFPHAEQLHAPYLTALEAEMKLPAWQDIWESHAVVSVFFGGGTPTLLPAKALASLLQTLRSLVCFTGDVEISLEMNPGTATLEDMRVLREAGFNRVSLGAQTLSDTLLQAIGRTHSRSDVFSDVAMLREAGFSNINLDFILALPGQTENDIEADLAGIAELQPEHISWYSLILEEKTLFFHKAQRGQLNLPSEDAALRLEGAAFAGLEAQGYHRYEISNFARPGAASHHNLKYWTGGEYLGFGLGAASYLARERYENPRGFGAYFDAIQRGVSPRTQMDRTPADDLFELVMMGLRKTAGIDRVAFKAQNGMDPAALAPDTVRKAIARGLMSEDESRLAFTPRGLAISNDVLSDMLGEWSDRTEA